ncbi:MAG: hypothetical protein KME20_15965 [Kaiparowitsia implicata GSE-PSE-MK54-09C]|jgi:hypothetical protein|nr:hypothetical protein [Kaiparowitsia implicata GSE-PSE-MK54-09C]
MLHLSALLQLLPGMQTLAPLHQQAGQQPDNLCGPYWVSLWLRSHQYHITPEQVAQQAGTVLPTGQPQTAWVPPGATPRCDYSLPLPTTPDVTTGGTSAQGLVRAVRQLTSGSYDLVPLQSHWTGDRLLSLLQLCVDHPEWNTAPLCNVSTAYLWGSNLSPAAAIAHLSGSTISPPPADWAVGHFLTLAGWVQGSAAMLMWVCDTYPQFGWQGYTMQPPSAIAAALNREAGASGGVLLFVHHQHRQAVAQAAAQLGCEVEVWDNGSPIPADWEG